MPLEIRGAHFLIRSAQFVRVTRLEQALPLPLELGPLNTARGSGDRCKVPERDLGQSPSGNRILCILALNSDIWWHQIY